MLIDTSDDDKNCVYAEQSTYNWVLAVASEIINTHGHTIDDWKASLHNHFSQTIHNPPKRVKDRKVFQKIFHGISLGHSIRNKYNSNYFNYSDCVGTISDFYYAIYNIFISFSMSLDTPENTNHGQNINVFDSIKGKLPYPFNIYSEYDDNLKTGNRLIKSEHYVHNLPGILSTSDTSDREINGNHFDFPLSSTISQDILHGYLRGTVEYYIWEKNSSYKKKHKIKSINTNVHKAAANKMVEKLNINFLRCLFRYRTKAHYRDFLYLTYNYTDQDGKVNNTMNIEFYNHLATIIEFANCCTIIHARYRIGRETTNLYLQDMDSAIKDTIPENGNYWMGLI